MSKPRLFKFSEGAKEDLLALNNEHSYSDIVGFINEGIDVGGDFEITNIKRNNLIIKLKENKIVGITLAHLDRFARHYIFKCHVCFDSQKIEVGDCCSFCDGVGCNECNDGLNFKTIACPNCTGKQKIGDTDEWSNRNRIERAQSHGNGRPIPGKARRNQRRKTRARN